MCRSLKPNTTFLPRHRKAHTPRKQLPKCAMPCPTAPRDEISRSRGTPHSDLVPNSQRQQAVAASFFFVCHQQQRHTTPKLKLLRVPLLLNMHVKTPCNTYAKSAKRCAVPKLHRILGTNKLCTALPNKSKVSHKHLCISRSNNLPSPRATQK